MVHVSRTLASKFLSLSPSPQAAWGAALANRAGLTLKPDTTRSLVTLFGDRPRPSACSAALIGKFRFNQIRSPGGVQNELNPFWLQGKTIGVLRSLAWQAPL